MRIKKTIYILMAMLLTILLVMIAHALIETWFIFKLLSEGTLPLTNLLFIRDCYLPVSLQITLLLAGVISGYFLGHYWWRVVYEGKRPWKSFRIKK